MISVIPSKKELKKMPWISFIDSDGNQIEFGFSAGAKRFLIFSSGKCIFRGKYEEMTKIINQYNIKDEAVKN